MVHGVATHITKVFCVTGVYLREITNTGFVILHLNVSCLSICFSSSFSFLVTLQLIC